MGDYTIDLTKPIDVDGLIATPTGERDNGVFYKCPGCGKDVRIADSYAGERVIALVINHVYPCVWFDTYRNRRFGVQNL